MQKMTQKNTDYKQYKKLRKNEICSVYVYHFLLEKMKYTSKSYKIVQGQPETHYQPIVHLLDVTYDKQQSLLIC